MPMKIDTKGAFARHLVFFMLLATFTASYSSGFEIQERRKADSTWHDWNFRISPYFWYIGFKGTIYRPPQLTVLPEPPPPQYTIDVSFKDIKNSIKFALMLTGQYRSEHIVTQFNISSLILESVAITPLELVLQDNIVNLAYFGGDLEIGYRVVKNSKFEFDALAGLKFVYLKIGLKTNLVGIVPIEGERSKLWVDPVIGTNLAYRPHRKIEFICYADFGPPFPDNYNTYQVMIGANYMFTKTFMISLGGRIM